MSEDHQPTKAVDDISGRTILIWTFGIWGGVGLIISLMSYNSASQSTSIGVGTSAYLMVGLLLWIGGMILFGVAALLTQRPS